MSKIVGKMAGCYSPMGKTFILQDEEGNDLITGVVTDSAKVFDATPNDVREGFVYAGNEGVKTGSKNIPNYYTTEGYKVITNGSEFSLQLPDMDRYDFTKLQAIICPYAGSIDGSVAAEKIAINDAIYNVNSTEKIATITKNGETQTINFGINNESETLYLLRFFTYKESI